MPLSYSPSGLSLDINGSVAFPQATYKRSHSIAQTSFVSYRCIGALFHMSGRRSHIPHF